MSRRDRHDSDRRGERRESQPDDEQHRRSGEVDLQEGDSLTALKAILAKVAALLNPLQLTQEESIRLVEQLYGSVLETDVRLAGEADDARKSSVLAHVQNTTITRSGDKIAVEYPGPKAPAGDAAQAKPAQTEPAGAEPDSAPRARASAPKAEPVDPPAAAAEVEATLDDSRPIDPRPADD
ncbi:MAG: hypothetical protein A2133_01010 [Actinobacteria bacterium RBG_16_64_13]|nr:MAG: hypothetical protein A2133_01010 [Actinobacteria bacterium RBG_16_64_13]